MDEGVRMWQHMKIFEDALTTGSLLDQASPYLLGDVF